MAEGRERARGLGVERLESHEDRRDGQKSDAEKRTTMRPAACLLYLFIYLFHFVGFSCSNILEMTIAHF